MMDYELVRSAAERLFEELLAKYPEVQGYGIGHKDGKRAIRIALSGNIAKSVIEQNSEFEGIPVVFVILESAGLQDSKGTSS